MIKVKKVIPKKGYKLWLKFEDGVEGSVDLSYLKGKGVFSIWDKKGIFESVFINPESGGIAWDKDVEICADALYLKITGKSTKEFFDLLQKELKSA